MIIGDMIPRNARLAPNRAAIVFEGREFSFAEHAERVYRLANGLIAGGVGRQDRIAVLAQNRFEYLELFGAGEVAGLVVNPVNFRLTPPEMAYILGDSDPRVVVFEARYEAAIASLRKSLPGVARYIRIGGPAGTGPAWAEAYEDVLASGAPARPAMRPRLDDTAYLFYTSGSSGRPKGVMLGQRAQFLTALIVGYDMAITAADRWLMVMPLFHVGAKYNQLGYHLAGATIYAHRRFDAASVIDAIERERITVVHLAPTMLQAVLDTPGVGRRDLSSLRMITYGAAPMPVPLARRAVEAFGPILMQRYGSTECAAATALFPHHHVLDGAPEEVARLASIGQPNPMTDVRVARDDGTDCAIGEPGELLIRNPDLWMQGYWRNEAATREALRDGWFHTGDIATLDAENFATIIDRKTEMIISGGENIYPREVEVAIISHPAVVDAAVIGVPDDKWGESVLAVVVRADGAEVAEEALIEHCKERIASYKKPSRIEFRDELPRFASGKVDRPALRAPYWEGRDRRV